MSISTKEARNLLKSTGDVLKGATSDLLASSDFISRTIGMNNSYEDIMLLVQALGRQPVSLLGKDYLFIFDHVRRNYQQGTTVTSTMYGGGDYWCPKFTFYKEKPTVRFADPYNDPLNLLDRWMPNFTPASTLSERTNKFYAESNDGVVNNKKIIMAESNMGTATGQYSTSFQNLATCDLIKKTNANFTAGRYNTLVARFHTNSMDSRDPENPTQTAISKQYGMSHGRNLLKLTPDEPNGYNNPYCRVWTYHHQYHRMADAIRPFGDAHSAEELESQEETTNGVGFRTYGSKNYGIDGGSRRLDKHGVLNYENGFVNIAPTAKIKDYFEHKADDKDRKSVSTKRCMFSIENLAWRDDKMKYDQFEAYGLSAEQRGPLGGRIMWFPPYDISFSENVSVKWNPNEFIGRGENIYTYTNTERRGNLSFTLLIDHPSILDYWTGHEKNGMKNQGMNLLPGNTDGVDGKDNQEQTLLRFFAGCDILSAKPQEYWMRDKTPANVPEPAKENVPQPNPTTPEEAKPVTKKIYAILYYPNNYSGKDDDAEFAVNYLMYGVGTQKEIIGSGSEATTADIMPVINAGNAKGYEVREKGISVASWSEISGVTKYGVTGYKEGVAESIGSYSYNGKTVTLAKQIGSSASKSNDSTALTSEWKMRRWYYRVDLTSNVPRDITVPNQRLYGKPMNYLDQESHYLNSTGFSWVKDNIKAFNLTGDDELVSFADLYCALNKEATGLNANSNNVEKIRKIISGKDGFKVTKVTFKGHNSSHGRGQANSILAGRNKTLASNRALTFKKWMMAKGFPMAAEADASKTVSETTEAVTHKSDTVDSQYIKAWRSASVVIEYEASQTEIANTIDTAANSADTKLNKTDTVRSQKTYGNKVDWLGLANNAYQADQRAIKWLHETEEGKKVLKNGIPTKEYVRDASGNLEEKIVYKPVNEAIFTMADVERITGKNYTDTAATNYDDSLNNLGISVKSSTVKRYDNEGEFFELLDKKSPFLHHLITDKIKYFDPAFHAISPEGFNARLTFLHQCTRQGATIGNSDPDVQTAYNLAFGRPPVCVLRVGDFYYTKIIINSMTINYDDPQWDLNPEGIGVMPMFAKINIDFNFIGGSDLAGPIARLQNAVSFNYYANTGVYDNRAEKVEYDPTGTGKETNYKPYNYPNAPGRKTAGIVNEETGEFRKTDNEEWEDV